MAQTTTTTKAIAYVRVSTDEQADSGAGLAAQRAAIEQAAERSGYELVAIYEDAGYSAKSLDRPAMAQALAALQAGLAGVLMVSKVDRLSRSVLDFAHLLDQADRQRWALVALDLGMDTSTPSGRLMAHILISTAEYERRLIGQRTSAALQARKAAGVKLGRPRLLDNATHELIRCERAAGRTLQAIADMLNNAGRTTPTGRSWSPALVRKITMQAG